MAAPPVPPPSGEDHRAVGQLRGALRAARFHTGGVMEAAGAQGPNLPLSPKYVPVLLRSLPERGRLPTLIRLFVAGVPVPTDEADGALAPLGLELAAAMHLLNVDGAQVRPDVHLVPVGPFLMCHDLTHDPARRGKDLVVGVSATSWTLANLTIRRPVARTLDLGTGCGFQAMLAASHSKQVTATDANPRALAFARFNAALNGLTNIEFIEGDLFEPLADERFDLVVANPPFVVSPQLDYRFRDGGWPRDELSRHVVQGAAGLLQEGGTACALVSWVQDPDRRWSEPLERWVKGLGCDSWLLRFGSQRAEEYVLKWNEPPEPDPERHRRTVDRWLDYLAEQAIEIIGYGAVALRRRAGPSWVRASAVDSPPLGPAGEQVAALFASRDYLERICDPAKLLGERFTIADDHRLEQVLRLRDGCLRLEHAVLRLERSLPVLTDIDPFMVRVVTGLDQGRTLGQTIDEAGAAVAIAGVLEVIQRLLELGFLIPVDELPSR